MRKHWDIRNTRRNKIKYPNKKPELSRICNHDIKCHNKLWPHSHTGVLLMHSENFNMNIISPMSLCSSGVYKQRLLHKRVIRTDVNRNEGQEKEKLHLLTATECRLPLTVYEQDSRCPQHSTENRQAL